MRPLRTTIGHLSSRHPLLLIHGYSDKGESFAPWRRFLESRGYDTRTIHVGNYVSLSNELTLKDVGEGLDRALREGAGLGRDEPFDAIVHSTGMLVVREWLTRYAGRAGRLKHLIGLAPATFGSPIAHKGRSWLGAIFKGHKALGPDFLEAGDRILAALELASPYTWDLAHRDFFAERPVYGPSGATPYPFIFIGLKDYGWLRRALTEPGTDGTVRWAGAGFNTRKIAIDLTVDPQRPPRRSRVVAQRWTNTIVPLVFLPDLNHGTIMSRPSEALQTMVLEALAVNGAPAYEAWTARYRRPSDAALAEARARRWQQFVVHAIDERGDGIDDYFLEVGTVAGSRFTPLPNFDLDVHPYREDRSFRCFHVDLDQARARGLTALALRILASSGTSLVGYHGYGSPQLAAPESDPHKWDAVIAFDPRIGPRDVSFFFPYTTTLVEICLNREPLPLEGANQVFWFA